MTDRKALVDLNDTPEDVATLYSWANLHGAKYRDFSVSRAQTREKARQRVQEAIEAERRRTREEAEAQNEAEAKLAAEAAILAEAQRKQEEASRQQALRAEQDAAQCAYQAVRPANPASNGAYHPAPADFPHTQPFAAPASQPAYAPPAAYTASQPLGPSKPLGQPLYAGPVNQVQYASASHPAPAALEDQFRGREDHYLQVRNPW